MKKLIVLLLALALCVSMCACRKEASSPQTQAPADTQGTVETPAPDADDVQETEEPAAPEASDAPSQQTQPTEPEAPSVPAEPEIEMSDDFDDRTISIGGFVYQLPCKAGEFLEDGWNISMDWLLDDGMVVEPGRSANTDIYLTDSSKTVYLSIENRGKSACEFSDCIVYEVLAYAGCGVEVEFPCGIKTGETLTVDELMTKNSEFICSHGTLVEYVSKGLHYYFYVEDGVLQRTSVEINMRVWEELHAE